MPLFSRATSRGRRSLHVAAAERTPSQVPCGGGRGAVRDAPSCSEASRSPGHRARLGASRSGLSPLVVLGPRRASCPGPSCCVGRAGTHAPGSCRMPAIAVRGRGSRGGSGQQSRARLTVDGTLIALPSAAPACRAGWFGSRRGHPRDAGVAWPQQSESLPLQITCPQGRESDSGLCICDSAVTESVGCIVQSAGGPHSGRWP